MNNGYKCGACGWIGAKAVTKSVKKIPMQLCPECAAQVNPWVRPLTERTGRCGCCGYAHFKLNIKNSILLRECRTCGEIMDPDTSEITRAGEYDGERKTSDTLF